MKNYVVGLLSMFENDLKLFKVSAPSEYDAFKIAIIDFCDTQESKQHEIDWQNSQEYPKTYKELYSYYEEIPFNVIEI